MSHEEDKFYDRVREKTFEKRKRTRLEVWEENLKAIAALDTALQCGMCFFWCTEVFFRDTKNVIDIFGSQRGLINFELILTFWKVKSGKGGVQRSATQKAAAKQQKAAAQTTEGTYNRKSNTNNSSRTTEAHKHEKTVRTAAKAAQAAAEAAQTVQTTIKTAKAATQTRGPRRRGPKGLFVLSLASSRWNFGGVFEILVNFTTIGY